MSSQSDDVRNQGVERFFLIDNGDIAVSMIVEISIYATKSIFRLQQQVSFAEFQVFSFMPTLLHRSMVGMDS